MPSPRRAFISVNSIGSIALLADRSLRIAEVPDAVWDFEISGYRVLYRWLRARNGEQIVGANGAALQRDALDVTWRIAELLHLYNQADEVLASALEAPLTRSDLDLPERGPVVIAAHDDEPPG